MVLENHLFRLPIPTAYCCCNYLTCFCYISIHHCALNFLQNSSSELCLLCREYNVRQEREEQPWTFSLWSLTLSSLIFISFISFGSWSTPDVLASVLKWLDDRSTTVNLSSTKCGSIRMSPAPSWSTFALLEPQSPPLQWKQ